MSVLIDRVRSFPATNASQRRRNLAMVPVSLFVLWLFSDQFAAIDLSSIWADIGQFSMMTWVVAALCTAISFTAISRYDVLITGFLGLNIPARTAMAAGWRATAISQLTGFGLITGSLSRWRMLSRSASVSLTDSAAMTALICSVFLAGWAVVTCVTLLAAPELVPGANTLALAGCLISLAVFFVLAMPPSFLDKRLPSCRFALDTVLLTFIDTSAAAFVIYAFLPDGYLPFLTLYAAFLMGFAAGMCSNLPGGVGAFELCLLTLLAPADPAPLVAALVAYRMIYYAAPAMLALPALTHRLRWTQAGDDITEPAQIQYDLAKNAPPELTLTTHGQLSLVTYKTQTMGALSAETNNCRIILGDAFGANGGLDLINMLTRRANRQRQSTCIYKCSPRQATQLRKSGHAVLRIGREATVDPTQFSLDSRKFRQLRRKLRAVEKAGITIAPNQFSWDRLIQIDHAWQARNGGANGFSMGVFDPKLLRRQLVLTALRDAKPIAFVSFHLGRTGWALDLIRSDDDCPDGTIHALIHEGITLAKARGICRFSLAAAPFSGLDQSEGVLSQMMANFYSKSGRLKGLYQFKQSFAPAWTPCYIAANSWPGLLISAIELRQLIRSDQTALESEETETHNHYADYEIDSIHQAWHALVKAET